MKKTKTKQNVVSHIIVNNTKFTYGIGCRMLKLKYDEPPFEDENLKDLWNDIVPLTFKEIARFKNLEERRVGIACLGLERLIAEVKPTLINSQTLKKQTTWINHKGELIKKGFNDTYELYKVDGEKLSNGFENKWDKIEDAYYIKCKDTSTDREYLIWVDIASVLRTNGIEVTWHSDKTPTPIQCVAWTIQTNIPSGKIEKIVRQGDCIMIKPKGKYLPLETERHLTEKEYKTLLVAES